MNEAGQFASLRSVGGLCADFVWRGRGTEGGDVVQRRAAKYRHSAGPVGLLNAVCD
jgi:hypothetical protein